jgi:hypothetical protein
MEDARKQGGRWFCSPSCLMHGSSGRWKRPERSKPVRTVRKIVKWTLIVLGLLVVAAIVGAALGLGNKGKGSNGPTSGLGSRSDPIPIGKVADIGGGWRLKVLQVTPNANREVIAAEKTANPLGPNPPLPKGARDFLVKLALRYGGGGRGDLKSLVGIGLNVMGVHNASYTLTDNSCADFLPKRLDLSQGGDIFSGQTARGSVCFQIAANDARSLLLYPGYSKVTKELLGSSLPKIGKVWFALHRTHRKRH